jgi:predicted dehydrogenase
VYVATPQSEHYPQARQALEANKHVIVEKAFTLDRAQAESLANLARARGRFLMEAMWTRFNPVIREVERRVSDGALGTVTHVRACFGVAHPFKREHRLFRPDLGGGTVLDQTVYGVTIADLFIGGEPTEVIARGQIGESGVEVDAEVLLRYQGDRTALLATSLTTSLGMGAVIGGTRARVEIDAPMWTPGAATLIVPDAWPEINRESIAFPREGRGYVPMLRAVSDTVQRGGLEQELHPLANTIRTMGVLDEIRAQIFAHAKA